MRNHNLEDLLMRTPPTAAGAPPAPVPAAHPLAYDGFLWLPFDEYLQRRALSRSTLDKIRLSPRHLQHYLAHPDEPTDAMQRGTVLHSLVEEELTGRPGTHVVLWDGGDRRGNAWKDFEKEHAGKIILKPSELQPIVAMRDALLAKPKTRDILEGAVIEGSVFWKDPATGVDCKARIDAARELVLFDLKTAADASRDEFVRAVLRYGYHRQGAWYLEGATHATGRPYGAFGIMVVESKAPYEVTVFYLDDELLERGWQENRENLDLYAHCLETNSWPGLPAESTLSLPRWA
jgi:hypothetical protein